MGDPLLLSSRNVTIEDFTPFFIFFIAPKIITGREAKSSIGGEGIIKLKDALMLKDVSVKRVGEDIMVEGYVRA